MHCLRCEEAGQEIRKITQNKGEKAVASTRMDPRIRRTQAAIRSAFVCLMQQKEYDAITVTDISEEAQINRKTFYAHYETKEHLYAWIMEEMFMDLFSSFMYEKNTADGLIEADTLMEDIARFFMKVEHYREMLNTLITGKTSYMAFAIAENVIRKKMSLIDVPNQTRDSVMITEILITRIKNFFFTGIDWWLDQTQYTPQEAAAIYGGMMQRSMASIFQYSYI